MPAAERVRLGRSREGPCRESVGCATLVPMIATKRRVLLAPVLLVLATACGSDGDSTNDAGTVVEPELEAPESDSDPASDDAAGSDEASGPPATGDAAATLTLANGETFEFATVLCTLEPQMAAGSEILFTATSYDDPGLDITQFGNEGTITGLASISVYDGNFETLWEANSLYGSSVELTLDGSTIRGTGSFYANDEFGAETVEGDVVANC